MRGAGLEVRLGDRKDVYRVLVWKPDGKRPNGRTKRRWEDNINKDFKEIKQGS
jgi:hypothetical protein